jgi:hypothetical protein
MKVYHLPTQLVVRPDRDLSPEALDEHGRLRVMPAAFWADTTADERSAFGNRHGLYSFPTVELVAHLQHLIAGRSAIEIAAGHGVLAQALGIPGTDSRQQDKQPWRGILVGSGVTPVPYGPDVIECHASRAVRRFKPQVVIGCFVTHRYERDRHEAGGNEEGVDERDVLANCETYILVGNENVHRNSVLWSRPHDIEYPPFVYSRAREGGREFIAVWRGLGGPAARASVPKPGKRSR